MSATGGWAPLSQESGRVEIDSDAGSGVFGRWGVDRFGLPVYRYTMDHRTDPRARWAEYIAPTSEHPDRVDAQGQIGNDHIVAMPYNCGYVQLWSQDRVYQWINRHDAQNGHYAGGYGFLWIDEATYSTLYDDHPAGSDSEREFGTGYFRRVNTAAGIRIDEYVYAPFGDDPVLLHDVVLHNGGGEAREAVWFEYWDVNPYDQSAHRQRGLDAPMYDAATRTLTVAHRPDDSDQDPLTIYAAVLRGEVRGFETDARVFFGSGGRADPDGAKAAQSSNSLAPAVEAGSVGRTLFVFRSPVVVPAGQTVVLRYAYGAARPEAIERIVTAYRDAEDPLGESQRAWADWVPQVDLGEDYRWLSRELQWSAYTVRSGATYEELCGSHTISEGGFYQYEWGVQLAYRDPLQHMLPMIYTNPELAREVLRYSARIQRSDGAAATHVGGMCRRVDNDDMDSELWLLNAAAEYALATRDYAFFDEVVAFDDGGEATLWEHLKRGYQRQESWSGAPHGGYHRGPSGDWNDIISWTIPNLTETALVPAQLAFVYPRLAQVAEARGDHDFAALLTARGKQVKLDAARQWQPRGWYARGYEGDGVKGSGAIYLEPQPWAILAGVPDAQQSRKLVANIRRYLTGIDAPEAVRGPAKIGTAQSPARADEEVTERDEILLASPFGEVNGMVGIEHAVQLGGAWYALNGPLTWALASLDGVVPNARELAFDELTRNTLTAHATAYPESFVGVLHAADACLAHYETREWASFGLEWLGQNMHQPAWTLFAMIKLAGIEPTAAGYRVTPHLPLPRFSLRLPLVGVEYGEGFARGYLRTEASVLAGSVRMEVAPPRGGAERLRVMVDGEVAEHGAENGLIVFDLPLRPGHATDWMVGGL